MNGRKKWQIFLFLVLSLFTNVPHALESNGRNDAYLNGYISSIIDRELKWPRDTYKLTVSNGVATLALTEELAQERSQDIDHLNKIDGLGGLQISVVTLHKEPEEQSKFRLWFNKAMGMSDQGIVFPVGDMFKPLLADPKQPQFFLSLLRYTDPANTNNRITAAAVGYGESCGMYRFLGKRPEEGIQFNIEGGLFAQFDLNADSKDLINADYIIGFPITYRKGDLSGRFRLYHQSSHLGDEFLLKARANRVNLSYESAELLVAYELFDWRLYAGGEELLRKEPSDLKRFSAHGGMEYESRHQLIAHGRLVGGIDFKSYQQHDWDLDVSFKAGIKLGQPDSGRRHIKILGEVYKGHSPNGQFYDTRVSYYGVGLYLGI